MSLLILVVPTALALTGDLLSYFTISADKRKGYHPNLQLWSLGFLFGVCANSLYLLQSLLNKFDVASANVVPLITIVMPAALVVIIVWAIAKVCQS
jgi:hypothetical protein